MAERVVKHRCQEAYPLETSPMAMNYRPSLVRLKSVACLRLLPISGHLYSR